MVALETAIGAADAEQTQPLALDSVFSIFSVTKAFTNLLVLRAIEQGHFALTSTVSELIPEFSGHGREKVQIWHLLSHQAGFPIIFEVKPEHGTSIASTKCLPPSSNVVRPERSALRPTWPIRRW